MKKMVILVLLITNALITGKASAAHPLSTDDTGTQGADGFQFEISQDFGRSKTNGVISKEDVANMTLTRGWTDRLDIFLGAALQATKDPGSYEGTRRGAGDTAMGIKWRYQETEGMSLGLKGSVTLPTGDEDKGLGKGRTTQSVLHMTQMEFDALTLLVNIGYTYNDNKTAVVAERKNLWNASAAGLYLVSETTTVLLEVGARRQAALAGGKNPSFATLGVIWHLTKELDFDVGLKLKLNSEETDRTVGVGITKRWGK